MDQAFRTRTGEVVAGPLRADDNDSIDIVTFSPGVNNLVAYGTRKGTVCVLNASTGAPIAGPKQIYNDTRVSFLKISPSTTNSAMPITQTSVAVVSFGEVFIWPALKRGTWREPRG